MLSRFSSRLLYPTARKVFLSRKIHRGLAPAFQVVASPFSTDVSLSSSSIATPLSGVQVALLEALISCSREPLSSALRDELTQDLKRLPIEICPKELQCSNDDHTLLIPDRAFEPHEQPFANVLSKVVGNEEPDREKWDMFWKTFAALYHSPRVVRCDATKKLLWSARRQDM